MGSLKGSTETVEVVDMQMNGRAAVNSRQVIDPATQDLRDNFQALFDAFRAQKDASSGLRSKKKMFGA
jgi:hypothetical protein